jgi:hypothetical protein
MTRDRDAFDKKACPYGGRPTLHPSLGTTRAADRLRIFRMTIPAMYEPARCRKLTGENDRPPSSEMATPDAPICEPSVACGLYTSPPKGQGLVGAGHGGGDRQIREHELLE